VEQGCEEVGMKLREFLKQLNEFATEPMMEYEVAFMDKGGELHPVVAVNNDDDPILIFESLDCD
jgi:hypothetical protein